MVNKVCGTFFLTLNVLWHSFSTQSTQSSLSAANTIVLSCVSTQKADMLSCKQYTQKLLVILLSRSPQLSLQASLSRYLCHDGRKLALVESLLQWLIWAICGLMPLAIADSTVKSQKISPVTCYMQRYVIESQNKENCNQLHKWKNV